MFQLMRCHFVLMLCMLLPRRMMAIVYALNLNMPDAHLIFQLCQMQLFQFQCVFLTNLVCVYCRRHLASLKQKNQFSYGYAPVNIYTLKYVPLMEL